MFHRTFQHSASEPQDPWNFPFSSRIALSTRGSTCAAGHLPAHVKGVGFAVSAGCILSAGSTLPNPSSRPRSSIAS